MVGKLMGVLGIDTAGPIPGAKPVPRPAHIRYRILSFQAFLCFLWRQPYPTTANASNAASGMEINPML